MSDVVLSREEIRLSLAEQLDLDPASIGFDDDLFELGLHSMRMIKLAAGWRRQHIDVNFGDLALTPTVQGWFDLLSARASDQNSVGAQEPEPDPEDGAPFGLATMQHGYWIGRADGQELGGVAAHLYAEFDGRGLDVQRLERAVAKLVRRHGMLRSQFLDDGTQRVLQHAGLPVWSFTDLRTEAAPDVRARLDAIRQEKTHQRMRADLGKVFDVSLTLLPEAKTRLHVDVDMLASDALSYRVLMADMAEFYRRDGEDLTPLAYDYPHYLADRATLTATRGAYNRERLWWQELLPQLPDPPALPLVPECERADPLRTVRYDHWLDAESKCRLTERAHSHRLTPAVVLASVFAEVVGRWSSEQRFLLNLPLFNREPTHRDVESLVGDFSSSVLVDVDVSGTDSVLGRARRLQQTLHSRVAHAEYPGLDVLRDLSRLRGEPVLASVVYTSGLNLGELFHDTVVDTFGEPVWIISQGPQVVLDAQVVELRGGLLLTWDVREQAFPAGLMDEMFARNHEIIDFLLADQADWAVPLTDVLPAAQAELRQRVNNTATAISGSLLHTGFFTHADTAPHAPALLWGDEGVLTYGELRDDALRIAGALVAKGTRPGDAVSIQLPKGPNQIVAALGVLAAGAAYVPIGVDQPDARREQMQLTGDVVLALVDERNPTGSGRVPALDIGEAAGCEHPLPEPVPADHEDIAYVLFTSGSTGQPKGVEVPHAAAVNTLERINEHFDITATDRSFALSALEFDLSVYDVFGLLSVGGAVVIPDEETRRDGQRAVELVCARGVSVVNCVPSLLDMLLTAGRAGGLGDTLRVVILGGDRVGIDLPQRLSELVPGCRFAGLGGTTETAIHSTVCEVAGPIPAHWQSVPYGVPLGNVGCRVVNQRGADCPDWVPGELWIGGRSVARAYRNDPERTADRFVEHDGRRWYRTGDLARYRPDGTIEFLGRRDHQVKVRGHRVELGEVEAALCAVTGVHLAIAEVVGETGSTLVAAVTLADQADAIDESSIRVAAALLLPSYMTPERVEILDEFPLTGNGKIDRKVVRSTLRAGAAVAAEYVAPEGDLEAVLAEIVAAVLGGRQVGVRHDFFSSGGDSVLATAVIARVREWLDTTEASVTDLFAARTVRDLAARLIDKQSVPGRLQQAAGIYLEVAAMSDREVLAGSASAR